MTNRPQRRACVMGHPVAQSRSPMLHRFWLEKLGINGAYDYADVPPEKFADFHRVLKRGAAACMHKPFYPSDIDTVLHRLLGLPSPTLTIRRPGVLKHFDVSITGLGTEGLTGCAKQVSFSAET